MLTFVVFLHLFCGVSLVALILMQRGKGADMGVSFGAGASQAMFGAAGATSFLGRAISSLAVVFFITSLSLAVFSHQNRPEVEGLPSQDLIEQQRGALQFDGNEIPSSPATGELPSPP